MIEIITNKGKCKVLISDEDADLKDIHWTVIGPGYAYHRSMGYLHKVVLERVIGRELVKPERGDHKDRNRLNCQRDNLRVSTPAQSSSNISAHSDNKSGYKGVYFEKRQKKWVATIAHLGKRHHIGTFETAEKASSAYDLKAKELFGEFSAPSDSKSNKYRPKMDRGINHFSGVSLDKRSNKWVVNVRRKNIRKYAGSYFTQEEAIEVAKKVIKELIE